MKKIKVHTHPSVPGKFRSYPEKIRSKIDELRQLIIETAAEIDTIEEIEETLKWGEPSYMAKNGSTIRIDWKIKTPQQYAMYFKCTSKLVPTFKEVYGRTFDYEKNRAILFNLKDKIPRNHLKECIQLALQYHSIKKLPRLGK
ncbi:MAG: DUF1801 domain-containing protein [Maribacter sp.]|nr:DUF1801 domain-containing protein [Maribacter sp.]MBT8313090.1 DUF1801 domain-containing protein [Maribacter sp.]